MTLPEDDVKALMDAGEAGSTSRTQVVRFDGRQVPFEIDPEIKRRLLKGLDDIGVTLEQERRDRRATSASASAPGPVTTAL